MNYNMYSNNMGEQIDPNYIYPRPYIDPMMYMNPYMSYGPQFAGYQTEPTMNGYTAYTNPYAENPSNPDLSNLDSDSIYPTVEDYGYEDVDAFYPNMQGYPNMNMQQMPGMPNMNMQGFPNMNMQQIPGMPNMQNVPPGMFPGMYMMPPGMMPGMFPGMFMMPGGMMPGMFPGMPQINMEEFDEEEM